MNEEKDLLLIRWADVICLIHQFAKTFKEKFDKNTSDQIFH